jgi:ubiquitin carboxyl-terminal hydrolase 16/45
VLTLQLKRFQQTISGCKKVNKHVAFPLDLDLAAFCSSTCVAMPNIELGGKVAYSLYGVVEHSGSLRGGHYVAYVKARPTSRLAGKEAFFNPPLAKPGDVPSFLAEIDRKLRKNTAAVKGDLKAKEAKVAEDVAADETNNNTVPNTSQAAVRKWFFVSDSSVSEVAEDKVLRSQAYLLFYERTL